MRSSGRTRLSGEFEIRKRVVAPDGSTGFGREFLKYPPVATSQLQNDIRWMNPAQDMANLGFEVLPDAWRRKVIAFPESLSGEFLSVVPAASRHCCQPYGTASQETRYLEYSSSQNTGHLDNARRTTMIHASLFERM